MTVRVGEVTSQVDIQPPAASAPAPGGTGGAGGPLVPSWAERDRYQRLSEDQRRRRDRTAGDRFDG